MLERMKTIIDNLRGGSLFKKQMQDKGSPKLNGRMVVSCEGNTGARNWKKTVGDLQ